MSSTVVKVRSAWLSKINWTQGIALVASLLAVTGIDLDAATQAQIVIGIQAAQAVVTWALKTFWTDTVTPSSAGQ